MQELQRYRSDFFGRLRELLSDRKDIRVVGDRFVFQSEVLFPSGQATMTAEGLAAIDQLATAIIELERTIPSEIDWALQVDGHTDVAPHRQLRSSLQLGAVERARDLGREIPDQPRRARQSVWWPPVTASSSRSRMAPPKTCCARNRRIELKLTNR